MELQRRKVKLAAARGGVSVAGVAEVIQTRVPAKLLNNAAVLYMRVGRPLKALELLEEALEVRDDVPTAHDMCLPDNLNAKWAMVAGRPRDLIDSACIGQGVDSSAGLNAAAVWAHVHRIG